MYVCTGVALFLRNERKNFSRKMIRATYVKKLSWLHKKKSHPEFKCCCVVLTIGADL
jgi:hypothetical protein